MKDKLKQIFFLFVTTVSINIYADGFIVIPNPRPVQNPFPLEVVYHKVDVTIDGQSAVTKIDQSFYNPSQYQLEGFYIFPIPKGAVINNFTMVVNGKETKAELLDSEKARKIYEDIVRQMRDPALLEYSEQNIFKLRIYPIEPRSEKKISISYTQVLESDNNLFEYIYPLNTEKFSAKPLKDVSVKIDLKSTEKIKNIYCPTHEVDIVNKSDNHSVISYEAENIKPDIDFKLYFSKNSSQVGLSLLSYQSGINDGYFLLSASPSIEIDKTNIESKGITFILDVSGSMSGEKLEQAKKALLYCVNNLNPEDHFNVIRFFDHSVQVDEYGSSAALLINAKKEFERNRERYLFLRWGQRAFRNFRVVPPATGIVHQVNLEFLARVVFATEGSPALAYPDTLIGTDSHTTMINGLGVLGWGVGGIEAEAAMLGQPISMLVPRVVGFKLSGSLPEGATATDLVLTVTEMLRKKGVVGSFVEFYGPGLAGLPVADRATIANMAPEYGATCGIFPIDAETLRYLAFTGRPEKQVRLVEAYAKEQGLFHAPESPEAEYSDHLALDLGRVEPSLAGPRRPQDRVPLREVKRGFATALPTMRVARKAAGAPDGVGRWEGEGGDGNVATVAPASSKVTLSGESFPLEDGAVVIAAITSCTNTSNPSVMVGAGLLAKRAVERGLQTKPWVKTSLAPGSKVVTDYLGQAGLTPFLEKLRFFTVGYGCTTCIGNSGPLPEPISRAIEANGLVVASVLSGNRNFEGRIHPEVRANYLASPPLVVAYALAGRIDIDLTTEPLGKDAKGAPVFLRDLWPSQKEIHDTIRTAVRSETFQRTYRDVYTGDPAWRDLPIPEGDRYAWEPDSTYVKLPPYFEGMSLQPAPLSDIREARALAFLGDSVTTDHISPAGSIKRGSPAGKYLEAHGVTPAEFNSYGSRRGNHEVMVRGTFANVRIRNRLVPEVEGGFTAHLPSGEQMTIYDAAMRYAGEGVPTIVLAGKEYGSGSSRDWAAKGPRLLGVRAVIAESYERIHRSNLIGMGILPLQFLAGENAESLGLTGRERFEIARISELLRRGISRGTEIEVRVLGDGSGAPRAIRTLVRIDTPQEARYYEHGGILPYVLRKLLGAAGR